MKIKLIIAATCFLLSASLSAQHRASYNADADEALIRGDYSDARMYFSEGLLKCDLYSIGGIIWIWIDNHSMRPSMQNLVDRCYQCLSDNPADTSVTTLLEIGYAAGIFVKPVKEPSDIRHPLPATTSLSIPPKPIDSVAKITKTTSIPKPLKKRPLIMVAYSGSKDNPVGLSLGAFYPQQWGGYVRYKGNLNFSEPLFYIRQFPDKPTQVNPVPEERTITIVADGVPKRLNSYRLTAGLLYQASHAILLSAGIGYGQRIQLYKYTLTDKQNGQHSTVWCTYPDYNHRGIAIETDIALRYKHIFAGLGCSVVGFSYAEINFGVGFLF
ncbi:MAG: hypothetical protein LBT73_01055 [Tannerellaceae bacterium]|jgi:hypothetical protein|nr:hypothetical protein [Tannerellaceae bacterium]